MNNKEFKALGVMIFGGSATFGAEKAGYKIDRVLEMTDDMHLKNAYHFAQNRKDIPLVPPSTWENVPHLQNLKKNNYDLLYANCPCSSLSQINRNASVDGANNVQFYRVFEVIKNVEPKAFIIENAPTFIKLGYPILLDCVEQLTDKYKFTVIRDHAGSHGVPMKRLRTLLVGWHKDYFNSEIPLLKMKRSPQTTVKDAIGDLYDKPLGSIPNHDLIPHRGWQEFEHLYHTVKPNSSIMLSIMDMWDEIKDTVTDTSYINQITTAKAKKEKGQNIWDKSPWRSGENDAAPSLTSVTELIHPIHNRPYTIREYARLMGYPDDFIFEPEKSETEIIQALAQGVPAPFIEYISSEIKEAISGNRRMIIGSRHKELCFQHHSKGKYNTFTMEELKSLVEPNDKGKVEGLEVDKTFSDLEN